MNNLCAHDQVGCALLQRYLCAGAPPVQSIISCMYLYI